MNYSTDELKPLLKTQHEIVVTNEALGKLLILVAVGSLIFFFIKHLFNLL